MAKDANYSNVSLLLHCNGVDGSTAFVDSSLSQHTVTNSGAQIVTAQYKFNGSSGEFTAGDSLTVPVSSVFGFGTGNFTIEYWQRPALVGDSTQAIVDFRPNDSAVPLLIGLTVAGAVRYYDGSTVRTGGSLASNTWAHVSWTRISNVNTIRINGTTVGSYTASQDFGSSKGLCIGANVIKTAERYRGHLAELRITKGLGRYTSDFTPPTAPFAQLGNLSGVILGANGDTASRLVRAMREDTGKFDSETFSNATTGAYMLSVNSEGAHTLNAYPAAGESLPALTLRGVVPV